MIAILCLFLMFASLAPLAHKLSTRLRRYIISFNNKVEYWKSWEFHIFPCVSGDDLINDGAESLKRLRDKIAQKSDEKAPSFLLVLTAVDGAYKREDGVCIAPIHFGDIKKKIILDDARWG